jgi:porphobilinogen synthase
MQFPITRMRRLRATPSIRRLVRETRVSVSSLIYPVFVHSGHAGKEPIASMPGQYRWTVDLLPDLAREVGEAGVRALCLFGLPSEKDERGSGAYDPNGIVQMALRTLKNADPDILLITDTCLDEYTTHGHCGIIVDGVVDNDATLDVLSQIAVSQAEAGADIVAPSDMMDGRVGAIRQALDESGYTDTLILAYAAKFSSAFYGPFREAADCAPQFGDRKSYQMDPANRREAIREVALDVSEGADMVMVKPAIGFLDIVREVRDTFDLPLAAYNVSGEFAMVKAAAANGWLDEESTVREILTSIARAGADSILTYHALDAARWMQCWD